MKSLRLLPLFITTIILLHSFSGLDAQSKEGEVIKPLLLDKAVLSGIGLQKVNLKDDPEKDFFQKNLFRGKNISVYIVSSESWLSKFNNFWFDEYIFLLHGQARILPEGGVEQTFHAGDYFFAPKGFTGEWEIQAGEHYHYELSVIASSRADSTKKNSNLNPIALNGTHVSGTDIVFDETGLFQNTLATGVELTAIMKAEQPSSREITAPLSEQMIQVLSGQITITDLSDDSHIFNTGDFFVLPDGFIGKWESKGHGVVKYLVVRKSF